MPANDKALPTATNISTTNKANSYNTNNIKVTTPPDAKPDQDEIAAKNFKKARKSSYEAPKSCEMIEDGQGKKKIKMYQEFNKFFSAKGANGTKGFAVDAMTTNEFGNALKDLGIGPGWKITNCANKVLGNKMFAMLKNQISAAAKKNPAKGYVVIFENPNAFASAEASKPKKKESKSDDKESKQEEPKQEEPKKKSPKKEEPKKKVPKKEEPKKEEPKPKKQFKIEPKKKKVEKTESKQEDTKNKPKPKKQVTPKKSEPNKAPTYTLPAASSLATATKISTNTSNATKTSTTKPKNVEPDEDEIAAKKFKKNRKSSYEAPKSCEMIEDGAKKKKIKMYQEFNKFFSAKGANGTKGFAVDAMTTNEFGNALKDLGIGPGWKITNCANKALGNKMFAMLKNQISAAAKKNPGKGYIVIFENENASSSAPKKKKPITPKIEKAEPKKMTFEEEKVDSTPKTKKATTPKKSTTPKASKPRTPRRSGSSSRPSVEVIEDGDNCKTLRLYHNMDKYIKSAAEKGPKGYKIVEFNKMFGNDLKELGVDIGWKLTKLGPKDVSKAFYQMTKTNLGVEFRNANNKGYEVTFSAPQ